jgi:hypothetical protein
LDFLYRSGFLNAYPTHNENEVFWNCFKKSLDDNKRGPDGKQRILSIIAQDFSYERLQKKLEVRFSIEI